jgi:hypothetical protein
MASGHKISRNFRKNMYLEILPSKVIIIRLQQLMPPHSEKAGYRQRQFYISMSAGILATPSRAPTIYRHEFVATVTFHFSLLHLFTVITAINVTGK